MSFNALLNEARVMVAPGEEPDAVRLLAAEVERLRDKAEGLDADLRCAVQTAYNRGAVEWARLNYKSMIPWLEGQANPTGGAG